MREATAKTARTNNGVIIPGGFKRGYHGLTVDNMMKVRGRLMSELDWNTSKFYSRLKGQYSFTPQEVAVIIFIFGDYNLNPWTGAPLPTGPANEIHLRSYER